MGGGKVTLFPVALFERGYADLISVIPPKATLSPNSKIAASSLGKSPGIQYENKTWGGYNWRAHRASLADIQKWTQAGANIGLRAGHFPGLDIDSLNENIVAKVIELAQSILGPAPQRVGRAPKTLLMYRTDEPFARMRITLEGEKASGKPDVHLIEMLGEGQQYLVHGIHATTLRPYTWDREPPAAETLAPVTAEKVNMLFLAIKEHYEKAGFTVRREGNGLKQDRTGVQDQSTLHAPTIDALRLAVSAIPNNSAFKDRDAWIKMGYAIRAACGDDLEAGLEVFAEWSERWEDGTNDPEDVAQNWRRMHQPYSVGWTWIAERARGFGYNDAQDDFTADPNAVAPVVPPTPPAAGPMRLSDQWLVERVLKRIGDRLRYVAARAAWYVWDGAYWAPDATESARYNVSRALLDISIQETTAAQPISSREARSIESATTLSHIVSVLRANPEVAVEMESLDSNPWLLNTPGGVINLKDGTVAQPLPEDLHTKATAVAPDNAAPERWLRFLNETTDGDADLIQYLQRLAGYCLTGLTTEQILVFIWGPGGNGKSVFLNAISEVLGTYATVSTMDVFSASNMDRHTTDIADLMGSRLVTASETQYGRRWDEQRLKVLSGGERVKARFMRQDNMMYRPTFKLLFSGNSQPHIRALDDAMRRRIHMVPFILKPAVRDSSLSEKLRAEYPQILGWMVRGCLDWQKEGLQAPDAVLAKTAEYFDAEDLIGRWIEDRCDVGEQYTSSAGTLFESWEEWCGEGGEHAGRARDLVQQLKARNFVNSKDSKTRRSVFHGIAVNKAAEMGDI